MARRKQQKASKKKPRRSPSTRRGPGRPPSYDRETTIGVMALRLDRTLHMKTVALALGISESTMRKRVPALFLATWTKLIETANFDVVVAKAEDYGINHEVEILRLKLKLGSEPSGSTSSISTTQPESHQVTSEPAVLRPGADTTALSQAQNVTPIPSPTEFNTPWEMMEADTTPTLGFEGVMRAEIVHTESPMEVSQPLLVPQAPFAFATVPFTEEDTMFQ